MNTSFYRTNHGYLSVSCHGPLPATGQRLLPEGVSSRRKVQPER